MSHLSPQQQQLILDFYFRCGEEEDIARGRDLIASNPEAAKLYARLEETLTDLDSVKYEPCPDNLAELTIARLRLASCVQKAVGSSPSRLGELLEKESQKTFQIPAQTTSLKPSAKPFKSHPNFLKVAFEFAAMAAAIVLVSGLVFPAFSSMRNHSRQVACSANLGRVGKALATYADDNDGRFASARLQPGDPWYMVGDQSDQARSSTRYIWQLVQMGYVKGEDFVCGGDKNAVALRYDPVSMSSLRDFITPQNVSYSVMLQCNRKNPTLSKYRKIILSDMNPVFTRLRTRPDIYSQRDSFEKICLNEDLRKLLSPNHNQRGQNVLYCDGGVEFNRTRLYRNDDIYTVRGVEEYTGRETPADENDIFLVP